MYKYMYIYIYIHMYIHIQVFLESQLCSHILYSKYASHKINTPLIRFLQNLLSADPSKVSSAVMLYIVHTIYST